MSEQIKKLQKLSNFILLMRDRPRLFLDRCLNGMDKYEITWKKGIILFEDRLRANRAGPTLAQRLLSIYRPNNK